MSDQEDFDQELTPTQEHGIAFIVILLFGAMYLFFMKGCQPMDAFMGQAFGPAQTSQLSSETDESARSAYKQSLASTERSTEESGLRDDVADLKSGPEATDKDVSNATDNTAQTVAGVDTGSSDDSEALQQQSQTQTQAQVQADELARVEAKARDTARIKSEATSLAAATAAQKLLDEKRFKAKQAELKAGEANLAIPAKPIETASTAQQATTTQQPAAIAPTKPNKTAEKPADSQAEIANAATEAASPEQTKPFDMNQELARVNFKLPDGRSIQIPQQGFETRFKQSILQGDGTQPIVFDRVYFYPGSDLINPESSNQILGITGILNTYKDINIKLRGHTDSTGPSDDNLTLSFNRSLNLKKQLVGLGIDSNRIQVEGLGSSEPISDNGSEKGRNKNRRIDLTILR